MPRSHGLGAGVHQQETAGAIRVFRLAGLKARLPHQGRLLVAQDARNRHARQAIERGFAIDLAAGGDPGQHGSGYAERFQQFGIPGQRLQVHQLGAAGVGAIGDVQTAIRAAGKVPQ